MSDTAVKIALSALLLAGLATLPLGIGLAIYFDNPLWLVLSIPGFALFMAG